MTSATMSQQLQRQLSSFERRTAICRTSLAADLLTQDRSAPSTARADASGHAVFAPGVEQDFLTVDFPSPGRTPRSGGNQAAETAGQSAPADGTPVLPSHLGETPPPQRAGDYFSDVESDGTLSASSDWGSSYEDGEVSSDSMYRYRSDDDDGDDEYDIDAEPLTPHTSSDSESESLQPAEHGSRDARRMASAVGDDDDDVHSNDDYVDADDDDDVEESQQADHHHRGGVDEVVASGETETAFRLTLRLRLNGHASDTDAAAPGEGTGQASAADAVDAGSDSDGVVSDDDDGNLSPTSPPASPSLYGDEDANDDVASTSLLSSWSDAEVDSDDDDDDGGGGVGVVLEVRAAARKLDRTTTGRRHPVDAVTALPRSRHSCLRAPVRRRRSHTPPHLLPLHLCLTTARLSLHIRLLPRRPCLTTADLSRRVCPLRLLDRLRPGATPKAGTARTRHRMKPRRMRMNPPTITAGLLLLVRPSHHQLTATTTTKVLMIRSTRWMQQTHGVV